MELFSAILLLCTLKDEPDCSTVVHKKPFTTLKQCRKSVDAHEIRHGKLWAEAEIYVVSSVCIAWAHHTNYQFNRTYK